MQIGFDGGTPNALSMKEAFPRRSRRYRCQGGACNVWVLRELDPGDRHVVGLAYSGRSPAGSVRGSWHIVEHARGRRGGERRTARHSAATAPELRQRMRQRLATAAWLKRCKATESVSVQLVGGT